MILSFFFCFIYSISGRAIPITKSSFKRLVENRPKDEIWILMLHTESNFLSKKLHPKFIEASKLAGGMFKFGVVDTKQQPLLTRSFNIKNQPSFMVFYPNGQTEYQGNGEPEDIISFLSKFLSDESKIVDESWFTKSKTPQAILFTEKKKTPTLWRGISNIFKKKKVKIGICNDKKCLNHYEITTTPKIVFINESLTYIYNGTIEFAQVMRTLESFIENRFKIEDKIPKEILSSSKFSEECIGGLRICVIHTKSDLDIGYEELKRKYSNLEFKWFTGNSNLPWTFMKENEFWIYNPKVDGLYNVDKLTNLGPILEKVFSATIEWIRRFDLMNDSEL